VFCVGASPLSAKLAENFEAKGRPSRDGKTARIGLVVIGVPVAVAVSGAIIGTTTSVPVIEVTRETTATRERVWELWADVPNRTG